MNNTTTPEKLATRVRPREILLANRSRVRDICIEHGGLNPRVFGSVARGDDTIDSDIDILVDFDNQTPGIIFKFLMLQPDLEKELGIPVNVVSSGGLKPKHHEILNEAVAL